MWLGRGQTKGLVPWLRGVRFGSRSLTESEHSGAVRSSQKIGLHAAVAGRDDTEITQHMASLHRGPAATTDSWSVSSQRFAESETRAPRWSRESPRWSRDSLAGAWQGQQTAQS